VAQALVHRPALLILDEPSSGLDPKQLVEMRALIRGLRGAHTVLISSHILSEISQTCDRLLVIKDGELVAQGTEAELSQRMGGGGFIEVEVRGARERVLAVLADVGPVRVMGEVDGVVTLQVEAPADLRPRVAQAVVGEGLELLRLDRGAEKLESLFLRLTQGGEEASS
jgi:ABC-2 type transport system ATP-binding protein